MRVPSLGLLNLLHNISINLAVLFSAPNLCRGLLMPDNLPLWPGGYMGLPINSSRTTVDIKANAVEKVIPILLGSTFFV